MTRADLGALAGLLRERNAIDERISQIIQRPMTSGHAGEWIASRIFDIQLMPTASNPAIDGRFESGPLANKTVNDKWYLKQEGLLDMTVSLTPDYYLVMTGPRAAAKNSGRRPWRIDTVYLFDARVLAAELQLHGVRIGVATSVRQAAWAAAEIHPNSVSSALVLSQDQHRALTLFS
jgi:hypothetical protein